MDMPRITAVLDNLRTIQTSFTSAADEYTNLGAYLHKARLSIADSIDRAVVPRVKAGTKLDARTMAYLAGETKNRTYLETNIREMYRTNPFFLQGNKTRNSQAKDTLGDIILMQCRDLISSLTTLEQRVDDATLSVDRLRFLQAMMDMKNESLEHIPGFDDATLKNVLTQHATVLIGFQTRAFEIATQRLRAGAEKIRILVATIVRLSHIDRNGAAPRLYPAVMKCLFEQILPATAIAEGAFTALSRPEALHERRQALRAFQERQARPGLPAAELLIAGEEAALKTQASKGAASRNAARQRSIAAAQPKLLAAPLPKPAPAAVEMPVRAAPAAKLATLSPLAACYGRYSQVQGNATPEALAGGRDVPQELLLLYHDIRADFPGEESLLRQIRTDAAKAIGRGAEAIFAAPAFVHPLETDCRLFLQWHDATLDHAVRLAWFGELLGDLRRALNFGPGLGDVEGRRKYFFDLHLEQRILPASLAMHAYGDGKPRIVPLDGDRTVGFRSLPEISAHGNRIERNYYGDIYVTSLRGAAKLLRCLFLREESKGITDDRSVLPLVAWLYKFEQALPELEKQGIDFPAFRPFAAPAARSDETYTKES